MQIPDLVMGGFEVAAGIFSWTNVKALWRDKKVRGVNPWATALFFTWGLWNCYYYPHLGQWAAFTGGLVILFANFAWVILAFKYKGN